MSSSGEAQLKTLIVDDNASFRGIIRDTLNALFPSMAIQEASEGSEAIQKVASFQPQVIFMDIRLPDENGLDLTKRIKASHPDTKVIIMTAYDAVEYREAATRFGAQGYFAKDALSTEQLEALIKSLVE